MLINFNLHPDITEPSVSINAAEVTSELKTMATEIDHVVNKFKIACYDENNHQLQVAIYQVTRFYTEAKNVWCSTTLGNFRVRLRIYELIEQLPSKQFIQISSSEIIKISMIQEFALSKTGSVQIILHDQTICYPSRRYISRIRKELRA